MPYPFCQAAMKSRVISAALPLGNGARLSPAHRGLKSSRPIASAAVRNGVNAAVASGNAGAKGLMGPNSRITRLISPLAGRPVNTFVKAVCRSRACKALRCRLLVVASSLHS